MCVIFDSSLKQEQTQGLKTYSGGKRFAGTTEQECRKPPRRVLWNGYAGKRRNCHPTG